MMTKYNEVVDHLVTTMKPQSDPQFDTPAYRNYKELVNNEKEKIDTDNLTESIYQLGFKIDTLLSKIISQLDTILEDDKGKNNDNWNDEIEEIGYD